jgi:hypothetical protein
MHWSDFEDGQPRLARLAYERMVDPGVVLVGTTCRDGTARISPVEPLVMDGDFWLSMLWQSAKACDLLRDPRVLVHSIVVSRDGAAGEVKIRGTARAEHNPEVHRRYANRVADTLGWNPQPGRFHLFAIDIGHITFIRYEEATGNQHVATWPPGREYVRVATSPTSLADPEPITDLIEIS